MLPRLLSIGLCLLALPALAQAVQPGWFTDPSSGCKIWNAYPVSNEQVTWSGQCRDEMADGKGVMQWILAGKPMKTKRYEGEMREGRFNGRGRLLFVDGSTYDGEFRDGERIGKGKMDWFNHNSYDGEWKNGVMDGSGTYKWRSGNIYTGQWSKGRQEGRGKFTFANGNSYDGEYKDGVANGRGRFRWANGDSYDGEFHNELPNGIGTLKLYSTDELITGRWYLGCLHGLDGRMLALIKTELECWLEEKKRTTKTE